MNQSLVKDLTGGDKVRARRMREDFWEFNPSHKILICTNHRPEVRGDDFAVWRRLELVPFERTFDESEQDKQLLRKLKTESAGIIAWAVRGCLEWQRDGLDKPEAILAATQDYQLKSDSIRDFVDARCARSQDAEVRAGVLFGAYEGFCEGASRKAVSIKRFGMEIRKHTDGERVSNGKIYLGIKLTESTKLDQSDQLKMVFRCTGSRRREPQTFSDQPPSARRINQKRAIEDRMIGSQTL